MHIIIILNYLVHYVEEYLTYENNAIPQDDEDNLIEEITRKA